MKPERRNLFARAGMRRAALQQFTLSPGLRLTAAEAAVRFRLSETMCDRLLSELAADGILQRTDAGHYAQRDHEAVLI